MMRFQPKATHPGAGRERGWLGVVKGGGPEEGHEGDCVGLFGRPVEADSECLDRSAVLVSSDAVGGVRRRALELPGEKKGGRSQNLVGPPQVTVLPLQLPDPLPFQGGHTAPQPLLHLRLPQPAAEPWSSPIRMRSTQSPPTPRGTRLLLQHQPHRPLSQLLRVPRRACHLSILSTNGVASFPGAVHGSLPFSLSGQSATLQ